MTGHPDAYAHCLYKLWATTSGSLTYLFRRAFPYRLLRGQWVDMTAALVLTRVTDTVSAGVQFAP